MSHVVKPVACLTVCLIYLLCSQRPASHSFLSRLKKLTLLTVCLKEEASKCPSSEGALLPQGLPHVHVSLVCNAQMAPYEANPEECTGLSCTTASESIGGQPLNPQILMLPEALQALPLLKEDPQGSCRTLSSSLKKLSFSMAASSSSRSCSTVLKKKQKKSQTLKHKATRKFLRKGRRP